MCSRKKLDGFGKRLVDRLICPQAKDASAQDAVFERSLIDIEIRAAGDLQIDQHHTVEDTGIALGQAVRQALGDMAGIARFSVDISGRPFLVFRTKFAQPKIGTFDSELVREFFQAFATHAAMTIHVENLYGENAHHIAESSFKGLARALRAAVELDHRQRGTIPSTKGSLSG